LSTAVVVNEMVPYKFLLAYKFILATTYNKDRGFYWLSW